MSQLSLLRSVASASRCCRLPSLLLPLLCLALAVRGCAGGVVYRDLTSGSQFSLSSSSRTAAIAAQYSTAKLQSFSFSVNWNGDASGSFSHYSTSPHLSIHATGLHSALCNGSTVTFSPSSSSDSCNFTASWSVAFDGLFYLVYSSGETLLNVSTQLVSQKAANSNLPANVVRPVAFFLLSGDSYSDSLSDKVATPVSIGGCSGALGVATALPNREMGTAWAASCYGAGITLPLAPPSGSGFAVAAWVKMSNLRAGLSWLGSATGELYHEVQDFINSAGLVDESWIYTADVRLQDSGFSAPQCTNVQGQPYGCINNQPVRSVGNMSHWTHLMFDWRESTHTLRIFVNGQLHFRGHSLRQSSFSSSTPHGQYTLFIRNQSCSDSSLWGYGYGIRVWEQNTNPATAEYYYSLDSNTGLFAPGPRVAAGKVQQHTPLFKNLGRATTTSVPSQAYSVLTTAADLTMTAVISPDPSSGKSVSTLDMGISWNMDQLSYGWLVPSYSQLVNTFNLISPTILRLSSIGPTLYWNYSGPQGELDQDGVDGQPASTSAADWASLAGFLQRTNSFAHVGSALFLQSYDDWTLEDFFNSTVTAVAALGSSLYALQTDNEQNLVAAATFASAALARMQAVQAAVPSGQSVRWSGPVSSDWNTYWMPQVWDLIHDAVQFFDFHAYDGDTAPSSSYALITQGLAVAQRQACQVRDLKVAYGVPLIISESESISSGGAFGYSDTYANAFWLINHALALYAVNLTSMYLVGPGGYYGDFTPAGNANSGVLFLPHFYSRLLLNQMQVLGGTMATATYNATLNVSVYATSVDARSYCVVISNWDTSQTVNVTLRVPGLIGPRFTVAYITALGLESNSGTSFAGGFVNTDGSFNPTVLYSLPAGSRTVYMPVESIALVYITASRRFDNDPPFTRTRDAVRLAAGATNFFPLETNYSDVLTGNTGYARETQINASCLASFVPTVLLPSGATGSAYYQPCTTNFVSTVLRYNNSFTVSAWVQAASLSLTSVFGSTLGFSDVTTIVSSSSSSGCCLLQHLPGLGSVGSHPCLNCSVGAWTHIAVAWDGDAGTPTFWIDGVAAEAEPSYNSSVYASSPRGAVMFGNGDPVGGGSLVGLVGYVWHARYSPAVATTASILSEINEDLN